MRIQKKSRILALMLALLMSLSACGENTQSPASSTTEPNAPADTAAPPVSAPVEESTDLPSSEEKPLFYTVNGLSYPSELGEPVLGDVGDVALSSAAEKITNVGDAIRYLQSAESFEQPVDTCKLFADLIEGDYDEVGLIHLYRHDNYYCLAYVQLGELFYPFDPFILAMGNSPWFDCIGTTDLEVLCDTLRETFPYNGENNPMDSWKTETLSVRSLQEDITTEPNNAKPTPQMPTPPSTPAPSTPSTPEEELVAYLTTPQYTREQIDQWVAEGLTLSQWAEKIRVPADAVQMLNAINYRETEYNDNVSFYDATNRLYWAGAWNAQTAFDHRSGNCAGTSNLINALLSDDFDQQGYVQFGNNTGGHIFNYFVSDGIYVFCDFIGIPGACVFGGGQTYPADTNAYIVYVGSSAEAFGKWYCQEGFFAEGFYDPNDEMYLYNMVLYSREGDSLPKGRDENRKETIFGNSIWDVHPKQYQDAFTILYEHEDYPIRFLSVPDPQTWPAEIR